MSFQVPTVSSLSEEAQLYSSQFTALEQKLNEIALSPFDQIHFIPTLNMLGVELSSMRASLLGKLSLWEQNNDQGLVNTVKQELSRVDTIQGVWSRVYQKCQDMHITALAFLVDNEKSVDVLNKAKGELITLSLEKNLKPSQMELVQESLAKVKLVLKAIETERKGKQQFSFDCDDLYEKTQKEGLASAENFFHSLPNDTQLVICRKLYELFKPEQASVDHLTAFCLDGRFSPKQVMQALRTLNSAENQNSNDNSIKPEELQDDLTFSLMERMPWDILEKILRKLSPDELGKLACLNTNFEALSKMPEVRKLILGSIPLEQYIEEKEMQELSKNLYTSYTVKAGENNEFCVDLSVPDGALQLHKNKFIFKNEHNLIVRDIITNEIVFSLNKSVSNAILCKNSLICLLDQKICIYDLKTPNICTTLVGEYSWVDVCEGKIVTKDATNCVFKVWDLESSQCLRTFTVLTTKDSVEVVSHKNMLIIGTKNKIFIYNINSGVQISAIDGIKELRRFKISGNDLIIHCTVAGKIKILNEFSPWDFSEISIYDLQHLTLYARYRLESCDKDFRMLHTYGNQLIYTDHSLEYKDINICPKSDRSQITTLRTMSKVESIDRTGRWLITGLYNGKIKIWDLKSQKWVATLDGNKSAVFKVKMEGNKVVSSAGGCHQVKVWDLKAPYFKALLEIAGLFSIDEIVAKERFMHLIPKEQLNAIEAYFPPQQELSHSIKWQNAIYRYVLKECLLCCQTGKRKKALEILRALPKEIQREIAAELYKLVKFQNDYYPVAEHALLEEHEQSVTSELRAKAIQNWIVKNSQDL